MTNNPQTEYKKVAPIIRPIWPAPDHIYAGVTTRFNAETDKLYQQGNIAHHVGDDQHCVDQNRKILTENEELVSGATLNWQWLDQHHGNHCVEIDRAKTNPLAADAVITSSPMTSCVVMSADCLPILLTDAEGRQVAAMHAGWRGLANGIVSNTLALFRQALITKGFPPSPIYAWLGPAIGPDHFEVGSDVKQAFCQKKHHVDLNYQQAFTPINDSKYLADLYQLATLELHYCGIHHVYGGGFCTYCETERFFSYRRSHPTGRMASYIYRTNRI